MLRNKKILSIIMSVVLVLGLIVMPSMSFAQEDTQTLTVLHINDVHGRVSDDEESIIGYSRLKSIVDNLKEEDPNLLLLDAGDTFHGTNFANLSRGENVVDLMNLVEFDAMVPGNHDFNFGSERLLQLIEGTEFPVVGANIVDEETGEAVIDEYTIITMDNELEVGIFGLSTEETKLKSHPNNTIGIDFEDPIVTSERIVGELEAEGVDFIIALSHIGLDEESAPTTEQIAQAVEGIDLIVDGHSHHTLPEGLLVGDTLIVQASSHMSNIGFVEIEMGEEIIKNASLISYEDAQEYDEDEEIFDFIQAINDENDEILNMVIGRTEVLLDGARENVRTRETNLGNLITDALLDLTDADVALTNGGGIRESVAAGDITMNDVLTVLPFENYPAVIEVTGQTIMDALEFGTRSYPEAAGGFPHVAGMTYEINILAEDGQRVENVMIAGQPIDLEETYDLVTNDFMAAGGDGYTMFEGSESVVDFSHLLLSDVLIDYIQEEEEINPIVEGRIVVTGRLNRESPVLYIEGYEDGTAKPNGEITREEVATIFNRLLTVDYLEMVLTSEHDFPDVESDRYSNDAIATLANAGVIQGYPDGTFKPGQSITRAEVVKMVSQFDRLNLVEGNDFSDSNGHWANHYINSAADKGWIIGYPDNTFRPNEHMTRAEFATLVNRMLERDIDLEDLPDNPITFPDLNEGSWYYKDMMAAANGI